MSCFCFQPATPEQQIDKLIQKQINVDQVKLSKEIKLLLLGAGESGKSTIFKQMKIIHEKGLSSKEELTRFKKTIYHNIMSSIRTLLSMSTEFGYEFESEEEKKAVEEILELSEQDLILNSQSVLTPERCQIVKNLWNNPIVQKTYSRRSEFQLIDSASYYLNDMDRISAPGYIPTQKDVLYSRLKTVGIVENSFKIDGYNFKMVDVGGQRNERRKWIHCFDDVTAVIFVTSLSEYDQKLFEEDAVNRMEESISLFADISNSRYFRNTPFIIFFNKSDLFEQKIKEVDLTVCPLFEKYTGGKNKEKALEYIKKQFVSKNKNKERAIYDYVTCATDTDNITKVFHTVKLIILQEVLKGNNMM